jgi:hypothetical protein
MEQIILRVWAISMIFILAIISGYGMTKTMFVIPYSSNFYIIFIMGFTFLISFPAILYEIEVLILEKRFLFSLFLFLVILLLTFVIIILLLAASFEFVSMAQASFDIDDVFLTSIQLTVFMLIVLVVSIFVV